MAASSSSLKPKRNYDVFLSFRGTDIRNNFLSHLYTALDQNGLFTYIDSKELRKGEQISSTLMKAIEESQVVIIVFSENYASSPWCLEEVAKIMECKAQKNLVVLPVFYKVEPREVREGRESYGKAIAKLESKFGKNSEKVNRWKEALFEAGSLSGWDLNDGDEAELIKRIVGEISLTLDRTPLHVAKHPVGIHPRVAKLKLMLNLEFDDDVLMVGLWGQGGIGKTTLAIALYNGLFRQFEGSYFLKNVRENSRDSKDLVSLQEKLLSAILGGKRIAITSVDEGINLMQYRLCHKKVLLVLDDVNDIEQLNALAGGYEWFGKGSRIIITTRNSHLLTSHGIDKEHIYEVQTLEKSEALELFNKHAFGRNNKTIIKRDLVDSALHYAKGLPLALKVLGSFLCGRREHEWKSALDKLAKSPNETINNVLKLSYDALDRYQKEIFLDIACFFKGQPTEYICRVLDSCDFNTTIEIQVLIEKSLITKAYREIQMHDLIQLMGMDIVKQKCCDNPKNRSRLWLCDDVLDALSGDMGTDEVKAIVLDLPKPKEIYIGPDAFTNMRMLRMLIMKNVHNSFQGPICLPNGLRWFEWPKCPCIPEFSSGPKKLVGLYMQRSSIHVVGGQFKEFENLKFIVLRECLSLLHMPDISCIPNLEELILRGCKNLEHVNNSVANHRKLWKLDLGNCPKLQRFPDIPNKNKNLQEIDLEKTSIEELPTSIGNLVSLKKMELSYCKKLTIIPSSIYKLQHLEFLALDGCTQLKFPKEKEEDLSEPHTMMGLPKLRLLSLMGCLLKEVEFLENPSYFSSLRCLLLRENNFTNLPICEKLYNLKELDVSGCKQLQEIPKIPEKLRSLEARWCKSLSRIPSNLQDVENVELHDCQELVRRFPINDWFNFEKFHPQTNHQVIVPGGEMPKWVLPNKEGYISFVASEDLYKKILGVAFCVVFQGKGGISFELLGVVNCKGRKHKRTVEPRDLDHMLLGYMASKELWTIDHFSPNDSSHFHISIRVKKYANSAITVKKCGFRLMCKPLENDSEVLLQDNQLIDPALLYEVLHEDNPISTKEESSSETKYLQVRNMIDFSIEKYRYSTLDLCYRNVRPGREMPKEFVLVEDGTISFMASQGLYDKLEGLYLCVVFGVEGGKKEVSFNIVPYINDQRRNELSGTLDPFDMDHVWFQFFRLPKLWGALEGEVNFGQFDESYLRFRLNIRVVGVTVKKLGYVIQSHRLEDALKVEIEKNRLMDVASLYEDDIAHHEWHKYRLRQICGMYGGLLGSPDTSLLELFLDP